MTAATFTGSCLCKAVNYELTTEPIRFYFCHCEQCRKVTGSAFAANIQVEVAEVRWVRGADRVKRYDDPERTFTKVFCTECGSGLPFLTKSGKCVIIPAGSLDTSPVLDASNNIFWSDRAAWLDHGLGAPCCDGFPDDESS